MGAANRLDDRLEARLSALQLDDPHGAVEQPRPPDDVGDPLPLDREELEMLAVFHKSFNLPGLRYGLVTPVAKDDYYPPEEHNTNADQSEAVQGCGRRRGPPTCCGRRVSCWEARRRKSSRRRSRARPMGGRASLRAGWRNPSPSRGAARRCGAATRRQRRSAPSRARAPAALLRRTDPRHRSAEAASEAITPCEGEQGDTAERCAVIGIFFKIDTLDCQGFFSFCQQ